MTTPKLIFGGGNFIDNFGINSVEDAKPWVDVLLETKHLVSDIDTSALYGRSEEYIGQLNLGSHFSIATKLPGQARPDQLSTKETVIAQTKERLSKLNVDKLDILFMHTPDTRLPVEETLSGIDALYKAGTIKRFGLTNYTPSQVEEVVQVCKEKGFVAPSVFQGSYNAVARLAEDELLPILRRENISFWAYSPIAGGFLAKTSQQFRDNAFEGRWDQACFLGKCYHQMYNKPEALAALDRWHEIAAAEGGGIPPAEMAWRWVAHNSAVDGARGDGLVIGAANPEQWRNTLAAIQKGPLTAETAAKIDALWAPLRAGSTYCNWDVVSQLMALLMKQQAPSN